MRKHFSEYLERVIGQHDDIVFITGDLGYSAFETLRSQMGNRFINAGVAEQGMISLAAGMASQGYRVICYSIAPFVVYRCLEQVRNDVCFHNMPVYIVGNGGGYHYGVLGSSHHALEDIATLSGLPNMKCYVPAFAEDMNICMDEMLERRRPAYMRLGVGKQMPEYLSLTGYGGGAAAKPEAKITVVSQSPVTNNVIAAIKDMQGAETVELYVVNRMPMNELPADIADSISRTRNVLTVEEHIAIGGLASAVSLLVNERSIPVDKFKSLHAGGYPDGLYGSQAYHQEQSGLDTANIAAVLSAWF